MLLLVAFPLASLVDIFLGYQPVRFGSFRILPMDFVYFPTILWIGKYALFNPKRMGQLLRENFLLTAFLALAMLYVILYTPVYGNSAVGEARKLYGFFLLPVLMLTVIKTPEDLRRFLQVFISTAALVAVIALGFAAKQGSLLRAVSAEAFLNIAFAAFAMTISRLNGSRIFSPKIDRALLLLFVSLAVLSAHRTVWLAVGLGVALLVFLYRGRAILMSKVAILTIGLVITAAAALVYFPEAGSRLAEKFAGLIDPQTDRTGSWRIEGWQKQLDQLWENDPWFGEGLGGYYSWRFSGGGEVKVNPHNAYVQMLLKFGLCGLTIYIFLVFNFFRKALRFGAKLAPGPMKAYVEMGMISFGAGHAYMMGYAMVPSMLAFFAITVTTIRLCRPLRDEIPRRHLADTGTLTMPHRRRGLPKARGSLVRG
jgi:O-antigen ligase